VFEDLYAPDAFGVQLFSFRESVPPVTQWRFTPLATVSTLSATDATRLERPRAARSRRQRRGGSCRLSGARSSERRTERQEE
jgi:hypothetical protein